MRSGLAASIVLVLVSAAMAVSVFPPFSWSLLAPFAWVPLFVAVQGKSARIGFRLGILHGILLFAGTLNWLGHVFGVFSLMPVVIMAFFPGVFASTAASLSRLKASPFLIALLTAIVWTGCEYFRSEWFVLRFPWITPGTGLPPNFLTSVIGVYGLSFLVALAAALVSVAGRRPRVCGIALIILLVLLSILRPGVVRPANPIHVAAIQTEAGDLDSCLRLSASIPGQVDAIVWPEYAVVDDIRKYPADLEKARALMADKGARLLVLANPVTLPGDKLENTALSIGLTEIFGTHVKNRPVHWTNDGMPGTDAPAIQTPLGKVSTPVCFDNDYAQVDRRAVTNGAEFLLVPSMDAAEWSAREHLQHAVFVAHRAAENGRWIVVSSTSGKTQIVDPHGNVTPEIIPLMKEGVLLGDIGRETYRTLYTRGGWLLGPACVVGAAITILALLTHSFRVWRRGRSPEAEVVSAIL